MKIFALHRLLCCLSLLLLLCGQAWATAIEGIVVTDQGPLAGATVRAYGSLRDALADKNPLISTPGQKAGFFRLDVPAGTYFLTASGTEDNKKYFAFHGANPVRVDDHSIWLPFAATPLTKPDHKNIDEPSRITGKLTYKGKPVSEAQVSLYPFSEKNIRGLGLETKSTNASGEFGFTPNPGSYLLVARKRLDGTGKMPLAKGDLFCFYGANPLVLEDHNEISVEIPCHPKDDLQSFLAPEIEVKRSRAELSRFREREPLKTGMGIAGRVTGMDGKPLQGLQVTAYRRDPSKTFQMNHLRLASENMVRTDTSGRYFLPVSEAGSYYLVARQYGGESPLKGELYGLYEANADHAVTVGRGVVAADIKVGRVMVEWLRREPPLPEVSAGADVVKAPAVIDHDTVWSGEVLIEGPLLVARAATLRIAPGTIIRFKRIDRDGDGIGDGELRVLGRIIARGTPDRPIRFMSAESEPHPGDWSYLLLFTSGEENAIEYNMFEHAFSGVQVHFSRALIADSIFRNNNEGIRFGRAELTIVHNEISNNDVGIRYHRLEGPVEIRGNIITENGVGLFLVPSGQKSVGFSTDTYIPDLRYYAPPLISGNSITANLRYNYELGERLSTNIPMGGNWWGTTDAERIGATVFDKERDPELGRVTFQPVLPTPAQGVGPRR